MKRSYQMTYFLDNAFGSRSLEINFSSFFSIFRKPTLTRNLKSSSQSRTFILMFEIDRDMLVSETLKCLPISFTDFPSLSICIICLSRSVSFPMKTPNRKYCAQFIMFINSINATNLFTLILNRDIVIAK